jgi:glycosyltransferase involved in cell wall biosynthesis
VKVFLAATSLGSDYGGPAFSVSALASALADVGVDVGLWAADGSAVATPLLPKSTTVQRFGGAESDALMSFGSADLIHDNGIWLPHNHGLAVLAEKRGIPRVVSIRGMLEPWAFSHKRTKKRIAWWLYQRRDLAQAQCHITTGEAESQNLRRFGLGVPTSIIPNGVHVPDKSPRQSETKLQSMTHDRVRTALFLGRIYPVKGLPMLVEAWARVRPNGWYLRIAGPDEAGHRKQVERAVSDAGLEKVISFTGSVEPHLKSSVFFDADLFILPSHSENFGMVIAEALAHGLPVLTTTGAPWPMLQETGCGWWVQPTVEGIASGLRQATCLSPETLQSMGEKGRVLVLREFNWDRVANLMLSTYEDVMRRRTREHENANRQLA